MSFCDECWHWYICYQSKSFIIVGIIVIFLISFVNDIGGKLCSTFVALFITKITWKLTIADDFLCSFLCVTAGTAIVRLLSHCNSVYMSVCPSICSSHGWISQKWCKLGSPNLLLKAFPYIRKESPWARAQNERGVGKSLWFSASIGIYALDVVRSTEIHALDMALGIVHLRVEMNHRCELRFHSHWAFTHASLSCVPLCIRWAFLVFHVTLGVLQLKAEWLFFVLKIVILFWIFLIVEGICQVNVTPIYCVVVVAAAAAAVVVVVLLVTW